MNFASGFFWSTRNPICLLLVSSEPRHRFWGRPNAAPNVRRPAVTLCVKKSLHFFGKTPGPKLVLLCRLCPHDIIQYYTLCDLWQVVYYYTNEGPGLLVQYNVAYVRTN